MDKDKLRNLSEMVRDEMTQFFMEYPEKQDEYLELCATVSDFINLTAGEVENEFTSEHANSALIALGVLAAYGVRPTSMSDIFPKDFMDILRSSSVYNKHTAS